MVDAIRCAFYEAVAARRGRAELPSEGDSSGGSPGLLPATSVSLKSARMAHAFAPEV